MEVKLHGADTRWGWAYTSRASVSFFSK